MKKRLKNKVLKAFTTFMAVLFMISATALDSASRLPMVLFVATLAYMFLFVLANREMEIEE